MTELRQRMIRDMVLAGLAESTKIRYVAAVRLLAKHYMTSPDQLTERQVEEYVLHLRDVKKCAKGTFQQYFHALKFLYVSSLNYDWPLFTKKRFVSRVENACQSLEVETIVTA